MPVKMARTASANHQWKWKVARLKAELLGCLQIAQRCLVQVQQSDMDSGGAMQHFGLGLLSWAQARIVLPELSWQPALHVWALAVGKMKLVHAGNGAP